MVLKESKLKPFEEIWEQILQEKHEFNRPDKLEPSKLKSFKDIWSPIRLEANENDKIDWIDAIEWARELIKKCDEEFKDSLK